MIFNNICLSTSKSNFFWPSSAKENLKIVKFRKFEDVQEKTGILIFIKKMSPMLHYSDGFWFDNSYLKKKFDRKVQSYRQKLICYNYIYLLFYVIKVTRRDFSQKLLWLKKATSESNLYNIPVQRSRTVSSL